MYCSQIGQVRKQGPWLNPNQVGPPSPPPAIIKESWQRRIGRATIVEEEEGIMQRQT